MIKIVILTNCHCVISITDQYFKYNNVYGLLKNTYQNVNHIVIGCNRLLADNSVLPVRSFKRTGRKSPYYSVIIVFHF